jgi:hypothetical protein
MLVKAVIESTLLRRYMVVEHAQGKRALRLNDQGAFVNQLPLHHLLYRYHWVHVDAKHVFVVAYFTSRNLYAIEAREDLSLLPLVNSPQPLCEALKPAHWEALRPAFAADGAAALTMRDVADGFAKKYGAIFAPLY